MVRRAPLAAVLALGLGLAAAACTRANDSYCCTDPALCADVGGVLDPCRAGTICDDDGALEGVPHTCVNDPAAVTCVDASDCDAPTPACVGDVCVPCASDADCPDQTEARCDLDTNRCAPCDDGGQCGRFGSQTCSAGVCVECAAGAEPDESAECELDEPICVAPGTCRGCRDHRECASGACDLAAGACVLAADIAYVDDAASGGNTECTFTMSCQDIADGIATGRAYVVIAPGSYSEVLALSASVTLIGYGATLIASTNPGNAIDVSGSDTQVGLYGLTITSSDRGVDCVGTATTRVTLVDATVSENTQIGVSAFRCDLVVARSRITGNFGGGLDVNQGGFDITSTLIDDNGAVGVFGGIRLDGPRLEPARLAFNTIVGNQRGDTATAPAGVACVSASPLPAFHSNIIDGNEGTDQVSGAPNCTHEYSLINPAVDGAENLTGDPAFADADGHLGEGSPARDQGRPASGVDLDRDGQPRPSDEPDIGADEYVAP